jgi:hypothetical protein
MVNPDGVVLGNYRTGMAGRDLNREFIEADQVLYPAVRAVKTLVAELAAKHRSNLIAFIDMHGHSGTPLLLIIQSKRTSSSTAPSSPSGTPTTSNAASSPNYSITRPLCSATTLASFASRNTRSQQLEECSVTSTIS